MICVELFRIRIILPIAVVSKFFLIQNSQGENLETAYASEAAFLQKAFRRTLRFFRIDSVPSTATVYQTLKLYYELEL